MSAAQYETGPDLKVTCQSAVPMAGTQRSNRRKTESRRRRAGVTVLITAGLLVLATQADADRFPAGCGLPNGDGDASSASIAANANIVNVGSVVEYKVTLLNPAKDNFEDPACAVSNAHVILKLPNGTIIPVLTNIVLNPGDPTIICPGDVRCLTQTTGPAGFGYPYTVALTDVGFITFTSQCPLPPGPTAAIIANTDGGALVRNSEAGFGSATYARCRPLRVNLHCLICTKSCVNGVGENGSITFSGTITNCGSATWVGVTVSDAVNGGTTTIKPTTNFLAPGATTTFSGSYVPANPCFPSTDTITVAGTDFDTGLSGRSSCPATCQNVLTPCISVTKSCNPPVLPVGATVTFSYYVTNCGNISLTNLILTDAFLGGGIGTISTLPPGTAVSYSTNYVTSIVDCTGNGVHNSAVAVNGTTACGTPITGNADSGFQVTCTPQLTLIPAGPYVLLAWLTNYYWFSLQSSTNLGSAASWTSAFPDPVVIGEQNFVIQTIFAPQQFFRLSQ